MFTIDISKSSILVSMDTFGEWLVSVLEKRGMSQRELARRAGLSTGALSHIISGNRGIGPDACKAIAVALDYPPEEVFRIAGLLPSKKDPKERPLIAQLIEAAWDLPDEDWEELVAWALLKRDRRQKSESQ